MAENVSTPQDSDASSDSDTPSKRESEDTATVSPGPRFNVNLPAGPAALNFTNDAQKVILITMTAIVVIAVVETVHNEGKKAASVPVGQQIAHTVVGGFVAGALLLGLSYILPEFASGLSVVALVATILDKGQPLWDTVSTVTKPVSSKPSQKGATSP